MESGEIALAIGTHSLISESVRFANLGLAVVDEQHRFGVAQRVRLNSKVKIDFLAFVCLQSSCSIRNKDFDTLIGLLLFVLP